MSDDAWRARRHVVLTYAAVFFVLSCLNALCWLAGNIGDHWTVFDRLVLIGAGELGPISMLIWPGHGPGIGVGLVLLLFCAGGLAAGVLSPRSPAAVAVGGIASFLWVPSGWVVAGFSVI